MSRPLKLTIDETKEELEKCLKVTISTGAQERLQMLYWLKSGQVNSRKELVKRLNLVRRQSVGGSKNIKKAV